VAAIVEAEGVRPRHALHIFCAGQCRLCDQIAWGRLALSLMAADLRLQTVRGA